MEKGFAIVMREVAEGAEPEGPWAGPSSYRQDEQPW